MRVLDLFSGIGGFSLGLEATGGFRTVAFCECDPYARRVLARHWPEVKRYHDVRTLGAARLAADGLAADVIVGGFPCQDVSVAGLGAGLDGERSGLWREMRRLVGEIRPRWVVAENVPGLRTRGADEVLGDLEALGYAATPLVVGAVHAGAPHLRHRVWIVANCDVRHVAAREAVCAGRDVAVAGGGAESGAAADGERLAWIGQPQHGLVEGASWRQPDGLGASGWRSRPTAANTDGERLGGRQQPGRQPEGRDSDAAGDGAAPLAHAEHGGREGRDARGRVGPGAAVSPGWWSAEPGMGRVAHGIPDRVDRLHCLGNAVVPAVVMEVGRAILAADAALAAERDAA
jgi:DNA (cytosine-5)-methyltransferase 1